MRKTVIIAEAGVNHNGSIEIAKKLIKTAASAGADYIKFQTFKTDNLVTKTAVKAKYQLKNINDTDISQYQMLKKLELTKEQHYMLFEYCNQMNIKFLSTAFDLESIDFLSELNLGLWKVPSGEINNYPYLKRIAYKNQIVYLSTGMSTIEEIKAAVNIIEKYGTEKQKITILQCNTQYPTPFEDVNLLAMKTIESEIGVKIGYSDHTNGIEVPIAAVALGATVIEKHFTLDKNMDGPDHKASIDPNELRMMIDSIGNIEKALGSNKKNITDSEKKNINIVRKSIIAAKNIIKGEILTEDNITVKRPGNGISPMEWENIIGKKAVKNFKKDDLIVL